MFVRKLNIPKFCDKINSFYIYTIMQIFKNIRWVVEDFFFLLNTHTKVFIPYLFWCTGIILAIQKSQHFFDKHGGTDNFINFIFSSIIAIVLFNLIFCPVLIISNLWVMNILKQANEEKPIQLFLAFLKSIGLKFILLIPFVLFWMGIQFLFVFVFAFLMLIVGISRGNIGGSIVGKLIGGLFYITLFMVFFLYLVTPGIVLDEKNLFSSSSTMMKYVKHNFSRISGKLFACVALYLILIVGVYYVIGLILGDGSTPLYYFTILYVPFTTLSFLYYLQIKAGQFYLWSKVLHLEENSITLQSEI